MLIPMLFSTGMMWYLIRRQNDRDARRRSGQLLDIIRHELDAEGKELVEEMTVLSQDPTLLNKLSNLVQRQEIEVTTSLQTSHKRGSALLLEKFARINDYDSVFLFDQAQAMAAFVEFKEHSKTLGFMTAEESERPGIKAITVDKVTRYIPRDDWEFQDTALYSQVAAPHNEGEPEYRISIFEGHIALAITVPILDIPQERSAPRRLGTILGYKFLDTNFSRRLAYQTQAEVNFFVDSQLYSGSLVEFKKLSVSQLSVLQQSRAEAGIQYLYTESRITELAFYQTYYPLIRGEDGNILSTLVVSLSKEPTYQHTREVVFLLAGVSCVCVLVIIPITFIVARRFADPIHKIAIVSEAIAKGHIDQHIEPVRSQDEIGMLSRSFHAMVTYLREMAQTADSISHGEIVQEMKPKTDKDVLGKAFERMIRYFKNVVKVAERMHRGDFSQRVALQSKHDVLGTAFNNVIGQLHSLVMFMHTEARDLAEVSSTMVTASEDASRNSSSQAKSVEVITSVFQEMALNIHSISRNLTTQSTATDHVRESADRITASSQHVANEVKEVSAFTEQTASSIEKMDQSVQEIRQQVQASVEASKEVVRVAKEGAEQVHYLSDKIQAIHDQMEIASESILHLQQESRHIREILEVIQDVMEQTNLLALNASIIAAQAGKHGRAFSVVADEVKALAGRTSESTKEISQFTRTIHAELSGAVSAIMTSANYVDEGLQIAEKTGQFLEIITVGAEQSSQLISHIADNIENHTKASHQVHQASGEVVNMLEDIARLTEEQHEQSVSIHEETEHLADIGNEIRQAVKEQEHAAHQGVETMESMITIVQQNAKRAEGLAALAAELSSQANILLELVEEFTVEEK